MPDALPGLTLEEQVGQLLMVGFAGTEPTPELDELIQRHHIGNVILFSRNIRDARQLRSLTDHLQELARAAGQRLPLLIAVDQENGMVRRLGEDATVFPGNMALGATGAQESAYEVALATGLELRALGINLNLAPVVDVNNNPANPVIGVRSFGEDPQQVARLAASALRGYQRAGVATCLKHFPGHGDTTIDPHLALPVISHGVERLEKVELVPFKGGIAAGSDCVMTAHIAFPALTGAPDLPATLAPTVIEQLLRGHPGFRGVIISDCLEMRAISETVGVARGAVLAQQAGNDLILISHRADRQFAGLEAIKAAVRAGEIAPERIRQAVARIYALKERLREQELRLGAAPDLSLVGCEAHRRLSEQIYERSLTLVRDTRHLLPLRLTPEQHLLVVYARRTAWMRAEDRADPEALLVESLRQRYPHTSVLALTALDASTMDEQLVRASAEADAVLVVTVNALQSQWQAVAVRRLLATGRPLIGLAVCSPYDLLAFPELGTYLATYEYTRPAIAAAVRVLAGDIQPQGRLPVSLPGLYPLQT